MTYACNPASSILYPVAPGPRHGTFDGDKCAGPGAQLLHVSGCQAGVNDHLPPHGYGVGGRFEFLRARQPGGPHDSYNGSFSEIMRDRGLTVVVMDMQGMGDSERVRPKTSAYFERFDQCADESNPCTTRMRARV